MIGTGSLSTLVLPPFPVASTKLTVLGMVAPGDAAGITGTALT